MTEPELCARLQHHVHELGGPPQVDRYLDLFATGALKSMQLLELINRLEDDCGVRVEQADVLAGRLRSISTMVALVAERAAQP